jgi:hypothetical protein
MHLLIQHIQIHHTLLLTQHIHQAQQHIHKPLILETHTAHTHQRLLIHKQHRIQQGVKHKNMEETHQPIPLKLLTQQIKHHTPHKLHTLLQQHIQDQHILHKPHPPLQHQEPQDKYILKVIITTVGMII